MEYCSIPRDTVNCIRTNNTDFIDDRPAKSPDLNPIEHVWDSLDRRLRPRRNPPANVTELRQALILEWNNIQQAEINTLVNSIRLCFSGQFKRWSYPLLSVRFFLTPYHTW